jgi:hypothetical protein
MGNSMTSMGSNYTNSALQINFILTNIRPHLHHNDHEQKDIYINDSDPESLILVEGSDYF